MKEYHVWDAIYSTVKTKFVVDVTKNERAYLSLRRLMQANDGVYEQYFRQLIDKQVTITGDFTPSYSLLTSENFLQIRKRIEDAGFKIRVIFHMRDPVDRCWSALRMEEGNKAKRGIQTSDEQTLAKFTDYYRSEYARERTRYDKTIKALRAAFEKESLYFGLYENLFTSHSLEKLSAFLEVDLTSSNVAEKVHVSKNLLLTKSLQSDCRHYFSEVYDFCCCEFPEARSIWM